ncbi:hypothetical protein Bbelb_258920 [Branchiostoma belcheri]|nr:hypothetical protein Bbelb_258920 [Branchiostoma belcheri]
MTADGRLIIGGSEFLNIPSPHLLGSLNVTSHDPRRDGRPTTKVFIDTDGASQARRSTEISPIRSNDSVVMTTAQGHPTLSWLGRVFFGAAGALPRPPELGSPCEYFVSERALEMKKKKSKPCAVALYTLGGALFVTGLALLVTAAVMATWLIPGRKETLASDNPSGSKLEAVQKTSVTPRLTSAPYTEDSSIANLTVSAKIKSTGLLTTASPTTRGPQATTEVTDSDIIHTAVNHCAKNPCLHGICENKDGGYTCTCSPGWTGHNCQKDIVECTSKPCQHGTCANKDDGYTCTCSTGWTGSNCDQDVNECVKTPCKRGPCVNKDGGYTCTCPPGWTGQKCEQDINECTSKLNCQHGTCVNKDGGYKCTCSPGWTGKKCEQDINECNSKPCQHGACVNKDGGYKCTCSPGWTGQNCQQDINECNSKPCQHGACVNKAGGYKCTCSPGWTGQKCERAKECQPGWSKHSNHCYKVMTETVTWYEANRICKENRANLTSVMDFGENKFISSLAIGKVEGMDICGVFGFCP